MTSALLIFAATFGVVFLLGLQQLNVEGRHMLAAFITSFGITATHLVLFKLLPGPTDWVLLTGHFLGGAFGIVASMKAHPVLVGLLRRSPAPTPWSETVTEEALIQQSRDWREILIHGHTASQARSQRSRVWRDCDGDGVIPWRSPL